VAAIPGGPAGARPAGPAPRPPARQRILPLGQSALLRHQRVRRVLPALPRLQAAVHRELQVVAAAVRVAGCRALSPAARRGRAPPPAPGLSVGRDPRDLRPGQAAVRRARGLPGGRRRGHVDLLAHPDFVPQPGGVDLFHPRAPVAGMAGTLAVPAAGGAGGRRARLGRDHRFDRRPAGADVPAPSRGGGAAPARSAPDRGRSRRRGGRRRRGDGAARPPQPLARRAVFVLPRTGPLLGRHREARRAIAGRARRVPDKHRPLPLARPAPRRGRRLVLPAGVVGMAAAVRRHGAGDRRLPDLARPRGRGRGPRPRAAGGTLPVPRAPRADVPGPGRAGRGGRPRFRSGRGRRDIRRLRPVPALHSSGLGLLRRSALSPRSAPVPAAPRYGQARARPRPRRSDRVRPGRDRRRARVAVAPPVGPGRSPSRAPSV